MNASVNVERNSWRLPPDETVQVADPRSKSAQVKEVNRSTGSLTSGSSPNRRVLVADCTVRFRCMYRCIRLYMYIMDVDVDVTVSVINL